MQEEKSNRGTTIKRFNNHAQSPYFPKATQELFRLPGDKSKEILQLTTGWSWVNEQEKNIKYWLILTVQYAKKT